MPALLDIEAEGDASSEGSTEVVAEGVVAEIATTIPDEVATTQEQ